MGSNASDLFSSDTTEATDSSVLPGYLEGKHLLAPLLTAEIPAATDQLAVAKALASTTEATLHLTNPIQHPEQTPPEEDAETGTDADFELLLWALEHAAEPTTTVEAGIVYRRRLVSTVLQSIRANDIDTVILPGTSPSGFFGRRVTEQIDSHAPCDVIVVNGKTGLSSVPSLLLPVAGGPHSGLATDVARRIAATTDAWIDILHVLPENPTRAERDRGESYVAAAADRIASRDTTSTWVLEAPDPTTAIIDQSQYYPVTIIGAPSTGRLHRIIHRSTNKTIRSNAESVVLSVRNNTTTDPLAPE